MTFSIRRLPLLLVAAPLAATQLAGCYSNDTAFTRLTAEEASRGEEAEEDEATWPMPYLPLDPDREEVSAIFQGETASGLAGGAVVALGDLDGDGRGDFATAARGWLNPDEEDPLGINHGRVYVHFGGSIAGGERGELADADVVIDGTAPGGLLGITMARVPDMDNDGTDELLVGRVVPSPASAGLLFLGRQLLAGQDLLDTDAFATIGSSIQGVVPYVGSGLAAPGDLDGDGISEIAVGAFGMPVDDMSQAGETYIFRGSTIAEGGDFDVLEDATTVIRGHVEFADCGSELTAIGDINGDGIGDLLVGSRRLSTPPSYEHGAAYAFDGATLLTDGDTSLDRAWGAWIGEVQGDWAGVDATPLGDIDGDGFDDFALAANMADSGGSDHGKVYVIRGEQAYRLGEIPLPDGVSVTITGEEGAELGSSVSGTGDVDGDGISDLLVGSANHGAPLQGSGRTYLYLGAHLAAADGMELAPVDAVAGFAGDQVAEGSGSAVAIVGDVSGDRLDDLLIGAPGYTDDAVGDWIGRIALLFSRHDPTAAP